MRSQGLIELSTISNGCTQDLAFYLGCCLFFVPLALSLRRQQGAVRFYPNGCGACFPAISMVFCSHLIKLLPSPTAFAYLFTHHF